MSHAVSVTEQDHIQGEPNAEYTLLEYGDFQCPSCTQVLPLIKAVQKHFGTRLKFVFRNFPLEQHEFAEAAAETAEFAAAKGKYWEMHDLLYRRQRHFSLELFPQLAEELGLDGAELAEALEAGTYAAKVEADLEGGEKNRVHATPTFFVNGQQFSGSYDPESLVEAIQS